MSKSRANKEAVPMGAMVQYSADALRYWAAGAGFGRDSWISDEQFKIGKKLVTKLWNVFRFSMTFLDDYAPADTLPASLMPTDRWLLARLQETIRQVTAQFEAYNFAKARAIAEDFFWNALADNYLELAKHRLYAEADSPERDAARYTLYHALLTTIKLLAPIMPHITEEIYRHYFVRFEGAISIHRADWPAGNSAWMQADYLAFERDLIAIAVAVRRYKSEQQLSLGTALAQVILVIDDAGLREKLLLAQRDLQSVTRAREIVFQPPGANEGLFKQVSEGVGVRIVP